MLNSIHMNSIKMHIRSDVLSQANEHSNVLGQRSPNSIMGKMLLGKEYICELNACGLSGQKKGSQIGSIEECWNPRRAT